MVGRWHAGGAGRRLLPRPPPGRPHIASGGGDHDGDPNEPFRLTYLVLLSAWACTATEPAAAPADLPSTAKGDWPLYTADLHGTRYSPLDQIDADNFDDLEVAWTFKTDNLGNRPEYKLEGTPLAVNGVLYTTAGTPPRRDRPGRRTGELLWMYSMHEGERGGYAPRQLSGRGLSYWTDGRGDERVLYVTPGYRLVCLDAKTGQPVATFGDNGVVDLKVGVVKGDGEQIDLETGEIGLHSTPTVVGDMVIVGLGHEGGLHRRDVQQLQGPGARLRRAHREDGVALQHDPRPRRVRQRHLAGRLLGDERQHRRVDPDHRGRGRRSGLPAGGVAHVGLLRRLASRRQPLRREPGGGRPEDRGAEVALPVRAPPHLGPRHVVGAHHRRRGDRRPHAQGGGGAEQAELPVRLRPHHRRAHLAHRGDADAAERRARREVRPPRSPSRPSRRRTRATT